MTHDPCPRCRNTITGRSARSRLTTDREVFICTTCGTDEAVREMTGQPPVPFGDWPVTA